ncbi:MAG: 4Fe-4S binding protein [Microcystaceae cyanobacterium]
MFAEISEQRMRVLRWISTFGWLLLIGSLFYDPITPLLTQPGIEWSPFTIDKITELDCVKVQGECLVETPYALGTSIFWQFVIPLAIVTLFIGGHELWRRICPLSFLSQIPRTLGIQRQNKKVNERTGKVRYELIKVKRDSWLGRNYLYLQLGLFYIGITSRILFLNSERLLLGIVLVCIILASILVGYLFGGKSWCQYFCPMGPIQKIYSEPRALLNSKAHEGERKLITQSMCRTVNSEGKEQSACVACSSPCIDIDAERTYWENIMQPEQQWLYYGYFGLAIGYFLVYFLYAGNWEYYLSGSWSHDDNQLASLLGPGLYIFGQSIAIPKLLVVPSIIGFCGWLGYQLGKKIEKTYKAFLMRKHQLVNNEIVRHRIFTVATCLIFNIIFFFAGHNFMSFLPNFLDPFIPILVVVCSGIWLHRTWNRNPHRYERESLANRLQKQLIKLKLDVSQFLENRSLEDLNADEIYVLAKVLPGFDKDKRLQAYKGMVKESIAEGYVNIINSSEMFKETRLELNITDKEHELILTEIEVENPDLFTPEKQVDHENWLRQESYHQAILDTLIKYSDNHPHQQIILDLFDIASGKKSTESFNNILQKLSTEERKNIQELRDNYSITPEEEQEIFTHLGSAQLWQTLAYTLSMMEGLNLAAEDQDSMAKDSNLATLNPEQRLFYEQAFKKFDKNGDNHLSLDELQALLRAVGKSYSAETRQKLITTAEQYVSDGGFTFPVFINLIEKGLSNTKESTIQQYFNFLDIDQSGCISAEELEICLKDLDLGLSDVEIKQMLQSVFNNREQSLSYEEFSQNFQQIGLASKISDHS